MAAPTVAVVGMSALRRDVGRLTGDAGPLNAKLRDAGRQAAEPVAAATRETVPRDSGTLEGTVRVTASKTGAAVRMGYARVPYAGPVDFGGWPEGREYEAGGRYLFPAAQSLAEKAAALYATATQKAIDGFAWTNEGNTPHD
jgi:hypothetical protein